MSDSSEDATRVDLGDDLVEKTVVRDSRDSSELGASAGQSSAQQPEAVWDSEDQFESARILVGEGLLDEAKKVLRKILIRDPGHIPSRQKLDEIHETELRQMFGDSSSSTRRIWNRGPGEEDPAETPLSADEVMLRLEKDLELGVLEGFETGGSLDDQFGAFGIDVDAAMSGASSRDRLDTGIAFLEMGLYGLACRQFQIAMQDSASRVAGMSLYAYAMILAARPFEALITLESALADPDVAQEQRVEFVYLVGRAQEGLKRPDLARACYQTVESWNEGYRDVRERLRRLESC